MSLESKGVAAAAIDPSPLPMVAIQPRGLEALTRLDLGVTLHDLSQMRIVLTDSANGSTVAKVAQEAQRLVTLSRELAAAPDGANTTQIQAEVAKVTKALTSKLAGQKGVFLSKDNASVELIAAPMPRGLVGDVAVAAGPSKKLTTAAAVAVDPVTGERVVLQPMGRVVEDLSLERFAAIHAERTERVSSAQVLATDKLAVKSLRTLSDSELDALQLRRPDGPIEHVTLLGEAGTDKTYSYPTRWFKKPTDVFSRRMVIEGPFAARTSMTW